MSTTVQSFKIEILGTDGQIQELGKIETSLKNLSRFRNQYNKDVEDAKKAEEAYGKQLATLNKLLSEGKIDSKAYQEEVKAIAIEQKKSTQILKNEVTVRGKLAAEQKSLIDSKGKLQKAIKEENAEIKTAAGSYRALQQELTRLDQQYKALSEAERESEFGQQLKGDVAGLRAQLKAMDAELGSNQRSVGDYGIVWDKLRGQLGPVGAELEGLVSKLTAASAATTATGAAAGAASTGAFTFAGGIRAIGLAIKSIPVAGQILAVVGAIAAGAAKILSYNNTLAQSLVLTQQLTKLQGDSLREVQAEIAATAETFDKDYREILIATNATAQAFGITQEEAIKKIQTGFALGADASDEYLAILKEFGPQFSNLGLDAGQFIALIDKQVEQGIFSDKGIDAIKEAGISLRELSPATRDALDLIGISSKQLEEDLRNGTKSYADAIADVSTRLGALDRQSPEVGTAIADIFRGAGEDAGLDYLLTLKDINETTSDLVDGASEYEKAQLELVDTQARYNEILSATFGEGAEGWQKLKVQAEVFLKEGVIKIIEGTVGIINYFRELYNESLIFRALVVELKLPFIILGTVVSGVFDAIINYLSNVAESIRAILTGDFSGFVDSVKNTYKDAGKDFYQLGKDLATDIVDGANEIVNGADLEPIKLNFEAGGGVEDAATGPGGGGARLTKEELDQKQKEKDAADKVAVATEKAFQKELEAIRAGLLEKEITALKQGLDEKVSLEELAYNKRKQQLLDFRKEAEGDVEAQKDIDRLIELETKEHVEAVADIVKGGSREQLQFYINALQQVETLTTTQQQALAQAQASLLTLGPESGDGTSFLAGALGIEQSQLDNYGALVNDFTGKLTATLSENRRKRIEEDLAFEQEAIGRASQNELTALEARYNNGLISTRTYEYERRRIEEKAEQDRLAAAKKAGEEKKKQAKRQAAIDLASALISILAKSPDPLKPFGPLYIAQVVQALGAYALQLSSINKQKFELGGRVKGPRHLAGGVHIEAEGDEYIIRRKAILDNTRHRLEGTALEIAEQLNGGGARKAGALRFESGGRVPLPPARVDGTSGGMTPEAFKQAMAEALRENRSVLPVDSLSKKQNEVELIETTRRWQ